jgi:nitroimidazol reductase NimA-like FMN-containing flavoprotein (pyridoxamine 5'-phosphate oxidase superfamily)
MSAPEGSSVLTRPRLEELPYDECIERLRAHSVGRIGIVIEDAPVVLPVNYRLVETVGLTLLAVRTRPGNVIERGGIHVALEIDDIDHEHHQGWSVLVRGTRHYVDTKAADFTQRFDPHPWPVADRDAWLIIQPYLVTGRRLGPASPEPGPVEASGEEVRNERSRDHGLLW